MAKARMVEYCNKKRKVKIPAEIKILSKDVFCLIADYFQIPMGAKLSLTFVNADTIRQLNLQNRGIDRATDVLSFPLQEYQKGKLEYTDLGDGEFEHGKLLLGDVVICAPVAKRQAEEYGHSLERELLYLFVHSVLHILGFDHESAGEKAEMRRLEELFMKEMGLSL